MSHRRWRHGHWVSEFSNRHRQVDPGTLWNCSHGSCTRKRVSHAHVGPQHVLVSGGRHFGRLGIEQQVRRGHGLQSLPLFSFKSRIRKVHRPLQASPETWLQFKPNSDTPPHRSSLPASPRPNLRLQMSRLNTLRRRSASITIVFDGSSSHSFSNGSEVGKPHPELKVHSFLLPCHLDIATVAVGDRFHHHQRLHFSPVVDAFFRSCCSSVGLAHAAFVE
ncbi:uncharacterized protein [Physcomitrium patens]|uniref:Uncharacterized protein n=1 Tax=Physcomitrium patens TaxID=3218 RepID=A0A7I4DLX7_PHYPA|nr:uncharacterized protein LOC112280474 [Physcomitrium patens]|eukprot:XP_024371774.1 uncharacterized protein LOC112280474 [Physcomitrella patens]